MIGPKTYTKGPNSMNATRTVLRHDREQDVTARWINLIKGPWKAIGWRVSSARMMRNYVTGYYLPAYGEPQILPRAEFLIGASTN